MTKTAKMRRAQKSSADIIVVGGNHSGLALAATLGAAGLRVMCLERGQAAKPVKDARTVALSFRSAQLLKAAGVWDAIEAKACPILDIRVADQDSRSFLDFHSREVGADPFGWIVENMRFRQTLETHIKRMPNVAMIYGAEVTGLAPDVTGTTVTLADGRSLRAMLAVAADGRASRCRALAGIETYGWSYHQTALVCAIAHELPHHNVAVEHFQPGGPFATLPMTGNRSSIVWTEKPEAAAALMALSEADFTAALQEKVEPYLGRVRLVGQSGAFPLTLQHALRYTAPRLALVADAAHGIHPIAGQGLNLGMGDIEILVEEILAAHRLGLDPGAPDLLRRYAQRRRFDNGNMILLTDLLDRLFSNAIPPVQGLRRFGLGLVQNMPRLRRFFMRTAMGVQRPSFVLKGRDAA